MGFGQKIFADPSGVSVDEKKYHRMIGSLLYLTASHPYIMFSTCLCARFQVNPKMSHLLAVKQIFRYLKGTKSLRIWYLTNESFLLQAYSDSKYGGLQLDRKSTTGGCQFLGGRLVSWSSKKQKCIALSTTEAEYIAASRCTSQVLWMKSQLLDYGYRF
ncbi:secreted RxLR effector protein 161-like [Lactuca sativa]|uniref:secreted RxLR effector protein 161-like n=1 Tax=Lactuca sativa TaxID=4236 RepID=UPI000CD8F9A4|nr:secreted RxLR effector protein 161-like [Lactuca sativa]